jgi:hypothetical protein
LPRCHALIPGLINPHGLTNEAMLLLAARELQNRRIVPREVDPRHWRTEGKHHRRGRRGCRAFIAGEVPRMIAEIEPNWPLDDCRDEYAPDGAHGQRRKPLRFLQPSRADGGRILAPAKARFHRDMRCLIRLEPLGICTPLGPQRRGQDGPPVRILGGDESLTMPDEAIADLDLGHLGLQPTASTCPFLGDTDRCYPIAEGMIAPGVRLAAPPSLPTTFILGHGLLGVGGTGKPAGFPTLAGLGEALDLFGLGGGVGDGCLMG